MPVTREIQQEHGGKIYTYDIGALAKNIETDDEHQFMTKEEKEEMLLKDTPLDNTVQFAKAAKRENIVSKENLPKIMGKICKMFSDLIETGTGFRNTTDSVNQGTEEDLVTRKALTGVDDKLGGVSFEREGSDIYAVYGAGADTVRKKLGSGRMEHLVDALGAKRARNLTYTSAGQTGYGYCVQYDLSVLPGYQDFVIGDGGNIAIAVVSGSSEQEYNYPATPFLCNQTNFDGAIDMVNENYWTIRQYEKLLPNGDANGNILKCNEQTEWKVVSHPAYDYPVTYVRHNNYMLYNPATGQLYHIILATIQSTTISVYRV